MKKILLIFVSTWLLASCNKVDVGNKTKLPDKDPKDYTLTSSSTNWEIDRFCPICLNSVHYDESMSDICNDCGTVHRDVFWDSHRSFRKIVQNGKWIWQYNYIDRTNYPGTNKSFLSEKQLHDGKRW